MVENDLRRILGFLLRMIGSSGSERRPQTADASQCSKEIGNVRIARREAQRRYSAGPYQLGWDQEQSLPEALQGGPLEMHRCTEPLEPVQQVVGQQDDLDGSFVGLKVFGRDFPQGVGVLQFADDQLGASALIVKAPEVQRGQ